MTAEAWVCRQFLGVGGPGAASTEAADYLLAHGPRPRPVQPLLLVLRHPRHVPARRRRLVPAGTPRSATSSSAASVVRGHPAGSWDPDDSPYGAKGGRIYCTALATLTLEVYYRFLRLYDEPQIPPAVAPRPRGGDRDPALGRLVSPNAPAGEAGPKR